MKNGHHHQAVRAEAEGSPAAVSCSPEKRRRVVRVWCDGWWVYPHWSFLYTLPCTCPAQRFLKARAEAPSYSVQLASAKLSVEWMRLEVKCDSSAASWCASLRYFLQDRERARALGFALWMPSEHGHHRTFSRHTLLDVLNSWYGGENHCCRIDCHSHSPIYSSLM